MPRKNGSVTDPDVIYIQQLTKLLKIRKKLLMEKRKAQRIAASQQKKLEKNRSVNSSVSKDVHQLETMQKAKEKILDESEALQKRAAALVAHLEENPDQIGKIDLDFRAELSSSSSCPPRSASSLPDPPRSVNEKATPRVNVIPGSSAAASSSSASKTGSLKSQSKY